MAKVINLPYPHALQKKILLDPARFKVINLGRRTGKSALVADKAKYTSLETGYNSLIISDTLTHAREIYWDEILPKAIPEQWATKNENLNTIKFRPQAYNLPIKEFWGRDINVDYSGSAHTPIIRLKGIDDNPDKLRGGKYGFIAVDEAAFANCDLNEVYDKILRPMVADTGGEIWIISTPDGVMNHFFTFATLAQNNLEPDCAYFHGTALDNPYFDPKGLGEWESIKRSYERKGKINEWKQEYMGEFSQPESMVFPMFDPDVHILRPDDIPDLEKMNHFIGMDFGWCLDGDTDIYAKKGKIKAKDVRKGDVLLTKNGYESVGETSSSMKNVIELDLDFGYNIRGNEHHKIYTDNRGFIRLDEVAKGDTILWTPSPLWAKTTVETQQAIGGTEVAEQPTDFFIEKFINTISRVFQKASKFIILMAIRIITTLKISLHCLRENTHSYINILKSIEMSDGISLKTGYPKKLLLAESVLKKLYQQIRTRSSALTTVQRGIIQSTKERSMFAKYVIRTLWATDTPSLKLVVGNVRTNSLGLQEVYGIRTNGTLFANGICVHNNDPFAVIFIAVEPRTNTWYIYDEIYEQHTSTDDKVMLMKPKMAGTYYNYIVGDTADPTEIENLKRKGIKVRPAKKSHDLNKAGISEIRGQMQLRELDAKPRLYVSARCRNMINEVMGLSYTKNAWGELTDVIDPRMPDHLVDALKYISHYMSNGGTPPPKAKKNYSATGRLLT